MALYEELETVAGLDGDTQDDIYKAIDTFGPLLALIPR